MSRSFSHACAVLLFAASCTRDQAGLEQLSRYAEPHVQDFVSFETWTERALSAVDPMATNEAREETVFAPLRHDSNVLFADVISIDGPHRSELHFPSDADLNPLGDDAWRRIIHPRIDDLAVLYGPACPLNAPRWWRQGAASGPCVLLSHETHQGDQHTLKVIVAYRATAVP